jgi:serine/threonine protein kinase
MPLSAGDKLGPYEILASIGAGGMGQVYRAQDSLMIAVRMAQQAQEASYRNIFVKCSVSCIFR